MIMSRSGFVAFIAVTALVPSAQPRAQGPLVDPPPFLEATTLFTTLQGEIGRQGPQRKLPHVLEADIFPHYIVAFASRCRNQPPAPARPLFDLLLPIRPRESWLRPCVSVTPAVRLRMLVGESVPVPAPSFMLRANAQWLFWQTHEDPETNIQRHTLSNFYFQIAHHSNGQSRCLFVWTRAGTCVTDGVDSETQEDRTADQFVVDYLRRGLGGGRPEPQRGHVQADRLTGNFSVTYIKIGFDRATHRLTTTGRRTNNLSGWRWGVNAELRPQRWMFDRMRRFYPRIRVGVLAGFAIKDFFGTCERFDEFVDVGLHGDPDGLTDWLSIAVQGTCVFKQEQGLGVFVRYYSGQDYYNASFLDNISPSAFWSYDQSPEGLRLGNRGRESGPTANREAIGERTMADRGWQRTAGPTGVANKRLASLPCGRPLARMEWRIR